ncbi:MAG: alkaline phosphatase [Bacteroidales bacterium]|nr:alkaline phosphatase [Bacteroidales bacterium]
MKKNFLISLFLVLSFSLFAQNEEVKNVILMIPDGTSSSVLALSRWYKGYLAGDYNTTLAVDPYLCGLVRTFSSNNPIGDSAPTTSCYMTGQPSKAGFVSTYPEKTDSDLFPVDATRTYQPLITAFEAARILKHKAIGLVATSYLEDATPADCMSHYYNRHKRAILAKQMVYNGVDVVISGGAKEVRPLENELKNKGVNVIYDDIDGFRNNESDKLWAFFAESDIPYHLDCDTDNVPSLAEMTKVALNCLAGSPDGFAIMVEGSKVDWAAHNDDAKTIVDEYLEFDKAVQVAIDFAKKDGHTVVVILPDHGNSGISIGSRKTNKTYNKMKIDELMQPLIDYTVSAEKLGDLLASSDNAEIKPLFKKLCNFDIADEDVKEIVDMKAKSEGNEHSKVAYTLTKVVTNILYKNTCIGFTTYGHTGEDVFLAVYDPNNNAPTGWLTNTDINEYLCKLLGVSGQLPKLTDELYARHQEVFDGYEVKIEKVSKDEKDENYKLIVKNKKQKLEVESYTNYFVLDGKKIDLESVVIYVDKNNTFYLPKKIREYLQ